MFLSIAEKYEIVELARKNTYRLTAEIFNERHPNRPARLHQRSVAAIFEKLRKYGTLARKKRTISPQTAEAREAFKAQVVAAYENDQHASTRMVGRQLQKSHMFVWKALKEMKFFPYKMQLCQRQYPDDPINRKLFCEQLSAMFNHDQDLPKKILWSDEKLFRTRTSFNRQIHRYISWNFSKRKTK